LAADFLKFRLHFLAQILPLVCQILQLLSIYVLSSVLCRGVCVYVWVCIQNRKVQNSLHSIASEANKNIQLLRCKVARLLILKISATWWPSIELEPQPHPNNKVIIRACGALRARG
jgi:hypothetical protein